MMFVGVVCGVCVAIVVAECPRWLITDSEAYRYSGVVNSAKTTEQGCSAELAGTYIRCSWNKFCATTVLYYTVRATAVQ